MVFNSNGFEVIGINDNRMVQGQDYSLCALVQRHSMSELKGAVRELLQCTIMGLCYKNVYYQ